jgi:hypothetical protein
MKHTGTLAFLAVAAMLSTGCYYDVGQELYPQASYTCDTAGITYSGRVLPLIQANCYSCHSGTALQGNVSLEGYGNLRVYAQNGKLAGTITHAPGYAAMPQGGGKLPPCDIESIQVWIDQGAPDN